MPGAAKTTTTPSCAVSSEWKKCCKTTCGAAGALARRTSLPAATLTPAPSSNASSVTKKLIAGKLIETAAVPAVTERVHAALLDELTLEDRINDEVRVILEAYSDEMQKTGANYQEMFRKVKTELVRKYKAVL